jgi:hypothetical protein
MPLQHRHTYAADFGVASLPATLTGPGVPRKVRVRAATQPTSVRFELVDRLERL